MPWLILLACALLAVQDRLGRFVRNRAGAVERDAGWTRWTPLLVVQLVAAVYGAYFGAGLGIMLLAILGVFLSDTLQRLNALNDTAEEGLATDNLFSTNFARPTVFVDPRRAMLGVRLNVGR